MHLSSALFKKSNSKKNVNSGIIEFPRVSHRKRGDTPMFLAKFRKHRYQIVILVIIILSITMCIKTYYDVNAGFIPPIMTIEGTFLQQTSDNDDENIRNATYITFDGGQFYLYRPDQSPLLDSGTYKMIKPGIYIIYGQNSSQCIVNKNNCFYTYNRTTDVAYKYIRYTKNPSFFNMHVESMPLSIYEE